MNITLNSLQHIELDVFEFHISEVTNSCNMKKNWSIWFMRNINDYCGHKYGEG